MEINLAKVVSYSKDCLQSRAKMRSIMLDLYPGKIREINIILAVYESGIPIEIKNAGTINDSQYSLFVQRIVDDYGLQEQAAMEGLDIWIDFSLKPGTASRLNKKNNYGVSKPTSEFEKYESIPVKNIKSVENVSGSATDYLLQSINQTNVLIQKFRGFEESEIIVPSYIEGKKVVGIGKGAYQDCNVVEKITIAEGIEYIEDAAFAGCKNLKEVILPTTLTRIGNKEKKGRPFSLTVLDKMKIGAFSCSGIKSIVLPENLTFLGDYSFYRCRNLESINIPNNIRIIDEETFSVCDLSKGVVLPEKLERINEGAFSNTNLSKIVFPSSVKSIGYSAFSNNKCLETVILNNGLLEIERYAFGSCEKLKQIIIPATVQKMGDGVFEITEWVQPSDRRRKSYFIHKKNENLIIYGYAGSAAIEYARKEGYRIENAAKLNI